MTRREQILERSLTLFAEKGYTAASMQDIADAVGIRKSSLYHHFESKEALLSEIVNSFSDEMLERAAALTQQPDLSPRERLAMLVIDVMLMIEKHRNAIDIFFRERHLLTGSRWDEVHSKRAAYEQYFREVIQQGQAQGQFRRDLDPTITTLGLFGMCNWALQWFKPEGRLSAEEVARMFITLFLEGLLAHHE